MKKRNNIPFQAFLLLLVSLISAAPSVLFHHHTLEIAAYDKATSCEKAIYYSEQDKDCSHTTHLSHASEKCWMCDTHTVSPFSFQPGNTAFCLQDQSPLYCITTNHYTFLIPISFSNRGPPVVSFFAA